MADTDDTLRDADREFSYAKNDAVGGAIGTLMAGLAGGAALATGGGTLILLGVIPAAVAVLSFKSSFDHLVKGIERSGSAAKPDNDIRQDTAE